MGRGSEIEISRRVYFPHSLGIFYSALTQFIGFPHYGDEYKVMGLAPYGEPKFVEQMREIVLIQPDGTFQLNLRYFRHHTDNVSYSWNDCSPEVGTLFKPALSELLGPARAPGEPLEQKHKDIARSTQVMYEEAFFALLNALHAAHPSDHLALSGGCAMNSVANGKVYLNTPFKKMYLPAAAGDAGGAIGAAAVVAAKHGDNEKAEKLKTKNLKSDRRSPSSDIPASQHFSVQNLASSPSLSISASQPVSISAVTTAYLGPEFSDAEIEALLRERGMIDGNRSTTCNS